MTALISISISIAFVVAMAALVASARRRSGRTGQRGAGDYGGQYLPGDIGSWDAGQTHDHGHDSTHHGSDHGGFDGGGADSGGGGSSD